MLKHSTFDPARIQKVKVSWGSYGRDLVAIANDRAFACGFTTLGPGEWLQFGLWFNEAFYILRGVMSIQAALPPEFSDKSTQTFDAGELVVVPKGAQVRIEGGPEGMDAVFFSAPLSGVS